MVLAAVDVDESLGGTGERGGGRGVPETVFF